MSLRPRIRAVHVTGSTLSGSTQMVLALVSGHDRKNFDPHVCFFSVSPADLRACAALDREGIKWRDVVKRSRYEIAALDRLEHTLAELAPDVVLLHGFGIYNYGALAARLAGVAKVVRVEHSPELYGPIRQLASAAVVPWVDSTIAVSHYLTEYLEQKGTHLPNCEVIYNGLSLGPLVKVAPPFSRSGRPVLAMTARLDVAKDHETLLRAVAELGQQGTELCLRLAGEGPLENDLRQLVTRLRLDAQVEFVGFVDDLAAFWSEADVAVLSTHYEGFGLAVAEAMAAGRPIVATKVAAIPELIEDGVHGRLVQPRSPKAMASAILQLVSDPHQAVRMGACGRERAQKWFAIEKTVAAYERHITALMDAPVSERMSSAPGHT